MNKAAIVTGAGGGLGRAMAEALAEKGLSVTTMDVDREIAGQLCSDRPALKDRILPLGGDVRSPVDCAATVAATLDRFGRLDVLVNNAGLGLRTIRESYYLDNVMFWEVPDESWDAIIDTNVKGAFLMAKYAVPHMRAAGWGRIINVTTSMDTMIRRGWTPYGPSKAALEACSAVWAKDLVNSGVSVNVLVPGGPAATGMVPEASAPDRQALVQPEVMKLPVIWLASDESNGFTGRRIVATRWDSSLPSLDAATKASWPAAWPDLGAQAVVAGSNPMQGG